MKAFLVLTLYCLLIFLASLTGGWVPLLRRVTHGRLQAYLSFSAGVMLGASMLHMLPEAFELAGASAGAWALSGATFLLIFERIFGFHQHEIPVTEPSSDGEQGGGDGHRMSPAAALAALNPTLPPPSRLLSGTVITGLTLHALTAGMALASTTRHTGEAGISPASFSVFLAILVHKPADAVTIATVLLCSGASRRFVHVVNSLYAAAVPLGAVLFYTLDWFVGLASHGAEELLTGAVIAITAGFLTVIALADVLPELQFHRHDRVRLAIAFLLGIGIMATSATLEAFAHHH